jgi:hypothetical protein
MPEAYATRVQVARTKRAKVFASFFKKKSCSFLKKRTKKLLLF